jgi:hypothetical protein
VLVVRAAVTVVVVDVERYYKAMVTIVDVGCGGH